MHIKASNVFKFCSKPERLYCWLILTIGILIYHCAPKISHYLTEESQQIHERFWASESLLYGHFMEGTKYQTPIFHFDTAQEGPSVLILGGTHGNEPAGFEAAYRLLEKLSSTNLKSGNIFIVPEANRIAVLKNSRRIPVPKGMDKERGNLNRCYPGDSKGLPMEREAYEIVQLIREQEIALLLDLHESPRFHLESKNKSDQYHGLGQTLIYTPDEKATWLGMIVLDQLNSSIAPGVKQFSLVERPIEHSAAWSAGEIFKIPAFTVETCKKQPLEERIQYQVQIVTIILKEKGML
ncbi:MAG: succinylglutamate desuccinylase/aspartoacylase family protein [bacterium]|nr:MAG: succinylglutamate desuccinylase/aspartoacylase family protein [bacterium]